jgi:dTDP-4-dehydrorhamnose 3,5-epimerase
VSFAFTPTALPEVVVIDPECFADARGFFLESWNSREFARAGFDLRFAQEGHSRSAKGVIRGMHFQGPPEPMGKLVRCTAGRAYDVAVDLRAGSPRFGRWVAVELSAENRRLVYVPEGFAHGFQSLADGTEIQYKMTTFYTPSAEGSIAWNDPELAIDWPIPDAIVSPRDAAAPSLREYAAAPRFHLDDQVARR